MKAIHPTLALLTLLTGATCVSPPPARFGTIDYKQAGNVTTATFNNPPINLVDSHLISDLFDFLTWLQPTGSRRTPKVVIFNSANPDFFLAHTDLHFVELPTSANETTSLNQLLDVTHLLVNITSTAFIASIDGRVNGAGNELALQMDMRFAGPKARVVQFENSIGLTPSGGGQLFWGPAVGRAKAMQYILAAQEIDGMTGKQSGLFNDYFNDSAALTSSVDKLAARIGLFPQHSLNDTKFTLNMMYPSLEQQQAEFDRFERIKALPQEQAIVRQFIAKGGNGTGDGFELNIPDSVITAFYNTTA